MSSLARVTRRKYLRLLDDKSCVPYRLTESQAKCWRYGLAGIALPNPQSLRGADPQRFHFKARWAALQVSLVRLVPVAQHHLQTSDGGYPVVDLSNHPASGRSRWRWLRSRLHMLPPLFELEQVPAPGGESWRPLGKNKVGRSPASDTRQIISLSAFPEICRLRYWASRQSKISRRSSRNASASPVSKLVTKRFRSKRK